MSLRLCSCCLVNIFCLKLIVGTSATWFLFYMPQILRIGDVSRTICFLRFGGCCHYFYLFYLFQLHTFIITFIQYIHPSPFAEASFHFFIACCSEGKTSLGCRAEIRARACQASAQPTKLYAASYWATLQDFTVDIHPTDCFHFEGPILILLLLFSWDHILFKGNWVKWFNLDNLIHSH